MQGNTENTRARNVVKGGNMGKAADKSSRKGPVPYPQKPK